MADHSINVTSEVMERLSTLYSEPKFHPKRFYPGAPSEDIRMSAERSVNVMLEHLQSGLLKSPQKSFVLSVFLAMLTDFEHADSEEREQACDYCERVMNLLHIESSDGLLNKWLYGFDPNDPLHNSRCK